MKTVIAIILMLLVLGVLVVGYFQARTDIRIEGQYLERNRPDVVAAIEAYRQENGRYPDSITNAIPRYYKGKQDHPFDFESYQYKNLGTNYYLKHFSSNSRIDCKG